MPELKNFFSLIAAKDTKALIHLFSSTAVIDVPFFDSSSSKGLAARIDLWIEFYHDRVISEDPVVFRSVIDGSRHIVEVVLQEKGGVSWDGVNHKAIDSDRIALPVALVGDFHERGGYYTGLRIYFGTWGLLKVANAFSRVKPVKKYFDALREGDVEKAVSTYEQDGYFREPADAYVVGISNIRKHYEMFLKLGGINLNFQTGTSSEDYIGLEYECDKWGVDEFAAEAGFAAYDIGRNGKISGARVYDSVVPPKFD